MATTIPGRTRPAADVPGRWPALLRRLLDRQVARASARRVARPSRDPTAFVRAHPEYILVEESLDYEQVISRNSTTRLRQPSEGRIRVHVPYDGGSCFGSDASADAEQAFDGGSGPRDAVIGHLVFVDHEETDLAEVLGVTGTYGRHPLRIPIKSAELGGPDTLTSDRFAFRSDISYCPPAAGPKVVPLRVDVALFDPGHQDGTFLEKSDVAVVRGDSGLQRWVAEMIKESAEFQPYLTALIGIRLSLPPRRDPDGPITAPVVRSLRITLPEGTTLPLSSVRLHDAATEPGGDLAVQSDARGGSFDWPGDEMVIGPTDDDAPRVFRAHPIEVRFLQPGELFRQREIQVDVTVELPDELMSGAQARFFDATGTAPRKGAATPLQIRTIITSRCSVLLYDAFGQRRISPSQSFCFDEIVPDDQRVADVRAALVDRRFDVQLDASLGRNGKKRIEHLIIATRRDGPRTMQLWIYIDGRRHPTQRESRHPWGHRYRSKLDSGTLNVHVRGLVHGEARGVTQEINLLHLALHDRFERMKALR